MMFSQFRFLALVACILSVSACVAPPQRVFVPAHWEREGVSQAETTNKYEDCVYRVGMNKVDPQMVNRLVTACMKADGFRWIPAHYKSAPLKQTPANASTSPISSSNSNEMELKPINY